MWNRNARLARLLIGVALLLSILPAFVLPLISAQDTVVRTQSIQLQTQDILFVGADQNSIQKVFVAGNLSQAILYAPGSYPADQFSLSATQPGSYQVRTLFDSNASYTVTVSVLSKNETQPRDLATYYMSGGPFELDLDVAFAKRQEIASPAAQTASPWDGFVTWVTKFNSAFPLWVKLLYLVLGIQFIAVGGLWIRREAIRRESTPQNLDTGNKMFLWFDVLYKFLLAAFLSIIAVMGGELIILFVLRFMFLASLDLLSLWDVFVAGFSGGIVVLAYIVRFILEKLLDLKPLEEA